jgi:hypothetical protein
MAIDLARLRIVAEMEAEANRANGRTLAYEQTFTPSVVLALLDEIAVLAAPVHQPQPVATEDERERILDRLALACHERGMAIQRQDVDRAGQWLTVIDDCRAALAAHHPHREDERKATDDDVGGNDA